MSTTAEDRQAWLRLALGLTQMTGAFVGIGALGHYGLTWPFAIVGGICLLPLMLSRALFYRNIWWGLQDKRGR